jgi:hypothetical protein
MEPERRRADIFSMNDPLDQVIAATAHWLVSAFPTTGGVHAETLARQQARQATTVAAWLRYPTKADAALLGLLGPGGSSWLDDLPIDIDADPWRTWVDPVVASWAAALLTDRDLAVRACAIVGGCEHAGGLRFEFARLTDPDQLDASAAALLRHPDLVATLADRQRASLDVALGAAAA